MRIGITPLLRGLLLLCLLCCTISAQFHIKTLSTDDGLPQNSILAILQSRDGYLWLATNDGLASFDGRTFTVYDKSNTSGFCCNRLTALYQDRNGALWIGTDLNTIIKFENRRFTSYKLGGREADSIVKSFTEDPRGHLVINSLSGVYRENNGQFPLVSESGTYYFVDRQNDEWMISKGRLISKSRKGMEFRFPSTPSLITTSYQDLTGIIWIGTVEGLFRFNGTRIDLIGPAQGIPIGEIRSVIDDLDGNLWIGSQNGLYLCRNGKFSKFEADQALPSDYIISLQVGRDGLIWAGTNDQGLIRINRTIISTISKSNGLPSNIVYPIFEDSRERVWIGTWPSGISIYRDGKVEDFLPPGVGQFDHPIGFNEDGEGRIWIATLKKLWTFMDGKISDFSRKLPPGMTVLSVMPDDNGVTWFGTNMGLVRSFRDRITIYGPDKGMADGVVYVLMKDREGGIWAGTTNGLTRFHNGSFQNYTTNTGLKSNHIRALHEDEEGAIWVGTFDGGLSRIKDGRIFTFLRKDGLFCKGVFTILSDERDNFWMSCNWGIYRVNRSLLRDYAEGSLQSVISVPYGREDGMNITECNGGAQFTGIKRRNGTLMIPTMGGVAVIDLERELAKPVTPPLIIGEILADERLFKESAPLTITPTNTNIEIHYDALSFFKPEKLRFRYMMTGLDQHWVSVGDQRTALYPYLPPGNYEFRLAASFDGGRWYESQRRISIFVPKPFWTKWWFRTLILLMIALTGLFIYRRNISKVVRQGERQLAYSRKLLGSLEVERRRIARELHDGVVNNLASLAITIFSLSKQVPQDDNTLKQKMIDVHDQAMGLTENVRNLSHLLHPAPLEHFGLLAAIRTAVQDFRDKHRIDVELYLDDSLRSISPEADICIYRIVQECLHNVARHANASNVLISLRQMENDVELIISDNGIGFDRKKAKNGDGLGLVSIQERLDGLGGKLAIDSLPGRGSDVIATIPLINKNASRNGT